MNIYRCYDRDGGNEIYIICKNIKIACDVYAEKYKYYPERMMQQGGIFNTIPVNTSTTNAGDNYEENYNVTGPVSVISQDPIDFMKKLKTNYRSSPGGK